MKYFTKALRSILLALLLSLALHMPTVAQEGRVELAFTPEIEDVESNLAVLEEVLKFYTNVQATTSEAAQIVFVYGIGQGEEIIAGPFASETVILSPDEPTLATRSGAIVSPWEAFDDPLVGFRDGENGIWGTGNVGFDDPLVGFIDPLLGFDDPLVGLNAVWGNGNVGFDPDSYGLVLFSMSLDERGTFVQHTASIVPFRAQTTLECTKQHPCNRLGLSFDPDISGIETDLRGLTDVLRRYTQIDALAPKKASQVVFVYGIGQGTEIVSGPFVSDEVVMVPGQPSLIAKGAGPIASPWDAYVDPLLGFSDPLLGFIDPLLGFSDPLLGFIDPFLGFSDPLLGLNAVWGNGNVGIAPGEHGLVLFSMSIGEGGAPVLHDAAIVPVSVTEGTAAKQGGNTVPEAFTLEAAYPNPFNPQTTLRYTLPKAAQVRMAVYDVLGREVALLVDSEQAAGTHTALFEASRLSSGVYLVRLEAGVFTQTQRVMLVK